MTEKKHCICIVGSGGVGKSCITVQFISNAFKESVDPTIIEYLSKPSQFPSTYTKQVQVDGIVGMVDILDTAGQDELTALRDLYTRNGDCFVLVYDVCNRDSFEEIERIYDQVYRAKDEIAYPTVLVANKVDLVDERKITTEDGLEMVEKLNRSHESDNVRYLEVSAKTRKNVDELFDQCTRMHRHFIKTGEVEVKDLKESVKEPQVKIKQSKGLFSSESISGGDVDEDLEIVKKK